MNLLLLITIIYRLALSDTSKVPLEKWFSQMDHELTRINRKAADSTWKAMIGEATEGVSDLAAIKIFWTTEKCSELNHLNGLNSTELRMGYLLCRGPLYSIDENQELLETVGQLNAIYENGRLCNSHNVCLSIEPDLETLMRQSRDPDVLLWAWRGWREITGPPSLELYPRLIRLENRAARRAGYHDIGECWREELEIPNLQDVAKGLYEAISPLHKRLHAYVRYALGHFYGRHLVSPSRPLPAHLLGNMWSHSWDSLFDVVWSAGHDSKNNPIDLDSHLVANVTSPYEMIRLAENFYHSLGLPRMPDTFWRESVGIDNGAANDEKASSSSCHGTAANLFKSGDYRMLACPRVNWQDFYVVTHEMGHIQYFMAYENLPTIFKNGANSAFQEAVGDTGMLAFESPKNLERMGFINNVTEDNILGLLMRQALKKIPHIAYGLAIDKWRWKIMSSDVPPEDYNRLWWNYRIELEGIQPPVSRQPNTFDAVAKFHVAGNVPYIRYFFSEFFQLQFLDILCDGVSGALHECDLHGNKDAGMKLRKMMSKGQSQPWNEILKEFSGGKYETVSAEPMLRFFAPLDEWLKRQLHKYDIPLGW